MSDHMTEWLNAYLDGELKGDQFQRLRQHLLECEQCRAELASLENLSKAMHMVPTPQFTPPERFAAQVGLRLAHKPTRATKSRVMEIGWWMIPVGLLVIWVLIGVSSWVADLVIAANSFGLLSGVPAWFIQGSTGAYWANTLAQFGLLSGTGFKWTAVTEGFARQFALHISIAVVYLGWIVVWWTRRKRDAQGQLLEG